MRIDRLLPAALMLLLAAPAAAESGLSAYEPVYALLGTEPTNAKLQLSAKYRLFGPEGSIGQSAPWLTGLHVAYTQTMFWDLGAESAPFESITFQPELLYILPRQAPEGFGLQLGVRHESNGRDGPDSRSVNTAYVQPSFDVDLGDDYRLTLGPRLWFHFGKLEGNRDITDYRGWTGLVAAVEKEDGLRLAVNARGNVSTGKGAAQADLSHPLRQSLFDGLDLFFHAQLFTGYGETLLDYNRSTTRLRIGISVVR